MTLLEFLQTHPSYVDATNPTDQVLLDWSNELVTVKRAVTGQDLLTWAADQVIANKLDNIIREQENAKDAQTAEPHAAGVYNDAKALWSAIAGGHDLELDRDGLRTMINNLVGNGISEPNKDALFAMSDTQVTRISDAGVSAPLLGISLINSVRNA